MSIHCCCKTTWSIAFGFKKYGASKMLGSDLKMGWCKKHPGQVSDFSTMAAMASWSHPPWQELLTTATAALAGDFRLQNDWPMERVLSAFCYQWQKDEAPSRVSCRTCESVVLHCLHLFTISGIERRGNIWCLTGWVQVAFVCQVSWFSSEGSW